MLMRGQLPDGMGLVDLGEHRLRDLGRPIQISQLTRDALTADSKCWPVDDGEPLSGTRRSAQPSTGPSNCWTPRNNTFSPASPSSPGLPLEAIEEVCSGDPVAREERMDLVTGLVARSLVVAEDSVLGTRFRLLETIRQYGEERLAEWGETDDLLTGMRRSYADLSARAAEHFYGPEQLVWARQINLERDNIRSALANAIDTDKHSAGRTARGQPDSPPQLRGEGEVFDNSGFTVIDMPNARDESGYPRVLMAAAWHAYLRGDFDSAEELSGKRSKPIRACRPGAGPG